MGHVVVEVEELSKRYFTGQDFQSYETIREALARLVRPRRRRESIRRQEFWALRDVGLQLERGEVLGIVGANGAGKTTLLKIVSRITEPTLGVSRTRGRVGALLEIGTGFHPELSGRENIQLNAAILGMSRSEVRERFQDVVEFSGVERFLDTPLKRYSAGMRLRLAFSVAAHFEADILAIDEVLAVGDADFQRRCLGKMAELPSAGRTVLFVSHDLGAITTLCSRAIWLDRGRVRSDGLPEDVVTEYLRSGRASTGAVELPPALGQPAHFRSVSLCDARRVEMATLERGEPVEVRLVIHTERRIPNLDVAVYIVSDRGVRVLDEAWLDQPDAPVLGAGESEVTLRLPPFLAPGVYVLGIWLGAAQEVFQEHEAMRFEVLPRPGDRMDGRIRVVQPPVSWSLDAHPETARSSSGARSG